MTDSKNSPDSASGIITGPVAGVALTTLVSNPVGTVAAQALSLLAKAEHAPPERTDKKPPPAMPHSADTLNISERAQNREEAQAKGQARLNSKNDYKHTGSLSMAGDLSLRAGGSIMLSGFGKADGKWLITSARHAFTRSGGLTTELDIARGLKPKKTTAKPTTTLTVFKADGTTELVKKDKGIPVR